MNFSSKMPPMYSMVVEVREIVAGLFLVIFTRDCGGLMVHKRMFGKMKSLLGDIVHEPGE